MIEAVAVLLVLWTGMAAEAADPYGEMVERWRRDREERLRADTGWLTVAGLFWLKEGEQTIGSGASCDIVLPDHSAAATLGTVVRQGGRITLRFADPARPPLELKPDSTGEPTLVEVGDLTLLAIRRGDKIGLRLRDKRSALRRDFRGCRWYPVKPEYRVQGRFLAYPKARKLRITSVVGTSEEEESPGEVEFEWGGKQFRLVPVRDGDSLWFIFRDATSGRTTYGGGRFLSADLPRDGTVTLDFNQAFNPPCAFNPYTTCPIPPAGNRLGFAVEAGEMAYEPQ